MTSANSIETQKAEVESVIRHYLTGISDASLAQEHIPKAFYSSTNLHSLNADGDLVFQPRDSLVALVEAGHVPKHTSEITQIEIINDMALAKVHIDMPDLEFFDYLTLLKLKVGWKIVSKTYTTVMK